MTARTYEVRTYGCQMNVHDSERLSGLLEDAPRGIARIAPDQWRDPLGDPVRTGDWIAFFDRAVRADRRRR